MLKPNYQFEKRKRELEKKRQKAEKAQKKMAPAETPPVTESPALPEKD